MSTLKWKSRDVAYPEIIYRLFDCIRHRNQQNRGRGTLEPCMEGKQKRE